MYGIFDVDGDDEKWMKNFEKNFTLATVGLAEVVVVTFVV